MTARMLLTALVLFINCSWTPMTGPRMPTLRGVNFNGQNFYPGNQWPLIVASDYFLTQKKMNYVRLNLMWELIQPVLNGPLDNSVKSGIANLGQIDGINAQIAAVTSKGGYIQLEIHQSRRCASNTLPPCTQYIIGEDPQVTAANFADLQAKICTTFALGNNRVILEMFNEPHDQDSAKLMPTMNAGIAGARGAGCTNLIIVSGNDFSSPGWFLDSGNQALASTIVDPLNNYGWAIHQYFDNGSGTSPNIYPYWNAADHMLAFTSWARAHGQKGYVGEFAVAVNSAGLATAESFLQYLEANVDVYLGWTWWGGGGWWQCNYLYRIDPFGSQFDSNNTNPTASASWTSPVDMPQMQVLQKHLPSSATAFNAWTIENNAPNLSASFRHGDYNVRLVNTGIWTDGSTNGNSTSQVTVGKQPTQNADGSVSFAASGQQLTTPLSAGNINEEVMATVSVSSITAGSNRSIIAGQTGASRQFGIFTDGGFIVNAQGSAVMGQGSAQKVAASTVTLFNEILTPGAGTVAARVQFDANGNAPFNAGLLTPSFTASGSTIGSKDTGALSEGMNGAIYDLVVFSANLDSTNRAKAQARLMWDLGLEYLLPPAHPYYAVAPSLP